MISHHLCGLRAELTPKQSPKAPLGPHELDDLPLFVRAVKAKRLCLPSRTSCGFLDHTLSGHVPDSVEDYRLERERLLRHGQVPREGVPKQLRHEALLTLHRLVVSSI